MAKKCISGRTLAKIQKSGTGSKLDKKTYYLTEKQDYKGRDFCLKAVNTTKVKRNSYLSANEYAEQYGSNSRHVSNIKKIRDAYNNDKPVPPVVLDERNNIIDGSHRMAAARLAGKHVIWAYVRKRQ